MKTSIIFMLFLVIVFTACNSDDDSVPSVNSSTDNVTSGTWKVSYYYDSNKEETSDFSGYSFVFNENGTLVASLGSTTKSGTWSIYSDDGKTKMDLNFGTSEPLDELNDDWIIIENSSNLIKLEDQSGDGSMDYLNFVKN